MEKNHHLLQWAWQAFIEWSNLIFTQIRLLATQLMQNRFFVLHYFIVVSIPIDIVIEYDWNCTNLIDSIIILFFFFHEFVQIWLEMRQNRSIAWGLALVWIVLSCKWGLAKPIDKLLSMRTLLPMSRLTYCAYLVHPVTQIALSLDLKGTIHIQHGLVFTIFLGNVVTSYTVALVLSLLFEAPVVRLLKIVFSKWAEKQPSRCSYILRQIH